MLSLTPTVSVPLELDLIGLKIRGSYVLKHGIVTVTMGRYHKSSPVARQATREVATRLLGQLASELEGKVPGSIGR